MIKISQLSIARGSLPILANANLTLYPKEKVGLVGHNGAGKSSLLSAMLGDVAIDQGDIDIPPGWKIAWIDQEIHADQTTVLDFAMGGDHALQRVRHALATAQQNNDAEAISSLYEQLDNLDGYTAESRVASILHGLGFRPEELHQPVAAFSGGWKMRMNLAKVLGSRADLILLDEPTNHLDVEAVIWLEQWIRNVDATVIVVSHDRDFLDAVCTHTVHLHQQQLQKYTGGYSSFERTFAERSEQIELANRKSNEEAAKLQRFIDRFKAKASKAKQAQSRVKRLEKIAVVSSLQTTRQIDLPFLPPQRSPDPLVVLRDAQCGYPQRTVIDKVSVEIRPGDRIGLLGANGNGKTTLVRSIVGELPLIAGERTEGKGLVYGYFAQDQIEQLDPASTPLEHMVRLDRAATEQQLRDFLATYAFKGDKVHQVVDGFSGGEKSRLALALLAYKKPNLLLLDEPTNHLDIDTRQALASSLLGFEGALIIVSHDRHLLESTTDQFFRVHNGQVTGFDGDLNDYALQLKLEYQQAAQANQSIKAADQANTTVKLNQENRHQDQQALKQARNALKKLEKQLPEAQAELAKLTAQLLDIDYSDPKQAMKAAHQARDQQTLQANIEHMEEQMLDLMMTVETLEAQLGLS